MNKKIVKFVLIVLILISLINVVNAQCYVSLDKETYFPSETIVASMYCDTPQERGQDYTLQWWLEDTLYESDTGITPLTTSDYFYDTLILPVSNNYAYANATLVGTELEGSDTFTVTGIDTHILKINNAQFSPFGQKGKLFAVDFEVYDYNNYSIDNAKCVVYGTDSNEAPLQECGDIRTYAGRGICSGILDNNNFEENKQYLAKIRCSCGVGDNVCFNNNNEILNISYGSTTFPFTVYPWIEVNTITNKLNYTLDDKEILVCANVTNMLDERISLEIIYNYRCGENDTDLNRIVIDSYIELRGISPNKTQNQCSALKIKNLKELQNKNNVCYAATDVRILNKDLTIATTYPTTSPTFNILSDSSFYSEGDEDMFPLGILMIIPLVLSFMFLVGSATLNEEHNVLRLFLFLLSIPLFFVSMHFGSLVIANYFGFTELIDLIGSTVYWIGWVFAILLIYFLIYLFIKATHYSAKQKEEKLKY